MTTPIHLSTVVIYISRYNAPIRSNISPAYAHSIIFEKPGVRTAITPNNLATPKNGTRCLGSPISANPSTATFITKMSGIADPNIKKKRVL